MFIGFLFTGTTVFNTAVSCQTTFHACVRGTLVTIHASHPSARAPDNSNRLENMGKV